MKNFSQWSLAESHRISDLAKKLLTEEQISWCKYYLHRRGYLNTDKDEFVRAQWDVNEKGEVEIEQITVVDRDVKKIPVKFADPVIDSKGEVVLFGTRAEMKLDVNLTMCRSLESLEGLPSVVRSFTIGECPLRSLDHLPKVLGLVGLRHTYDLVKRNGNMVTSFHGSAREILPNISDEEVIFLDEVTHNTELLDAWIDSKDQPREFVSRRHGTFHGIKYGV